MTGKETITEAELATAIKNMGWSYPEGRARRLFDKVIGRAPEAGTGLFRVTVERIDGGHGVHSAEIRAGNWLAAAKAAGDVSTAWAYTKKGQEGD